MLLVKYMYANVNVNQIRMQRYPIKKYSLLVLIIDVYELDFPYFLYLFD